MLLDHKSNINTATSHVFSRVFPRDFSVLVTARARENSDGYVFTVSDLMGFVKLGVRVGSEAGFEYCDQSGPQVRKPPYWPTTERAPFFVSVPRLFQRSPIMAVHTTRCP